MDPDVAAQLLSVSRANLFRLRAAWLQHPDTFSLRLSGGNHRTLWSTEIQKFLKTFLPLQQPPNYQLVADELATRFAFQRDRKSVAAYARHHFPLLVSVPAPTPKSRRRWERARVGDLWQHDSSIHQWWPSEAYFTRYESGPMARTVTGTSQLFVRVPVTCKADFGFISTYGF